MARLNQSNSQRQCYGCVEAQANGLAGVSSAAKAVNDRERLEAEVMSITDNVRRRLASELHDNLGQLLYGTSLLVGTLLREAKETQSPLLAKIEQTALCTNEALEVCRALAHGAAPTIDGGLAAALRDLAARTVAIGIECRADISDEASGIVSGACALDLYRVAQEATTNALKHARCQRIELKLNVSAMAVELSVQDDGQGFSGIGTGEGIGLRTMRDRAASAGGVLELRTKPGHGTSLRVVVPMLVGRPVHANGAL
jgi:signal transduction histidine kinase